MLTSRLEWLLECLAGEMHVKLLTVACVTWLVPSVCGVNLGTCILQGDPQHPALFKDGNFIIGGAFTIHYYLRTEKHTYTRRPQPLECSGRLEFDKSIAYNLTSLNGLN